MYRFKTPRFRQARGFTMTEMMVALLVLSVGLLGIAALQLTSLRSTHTSAMRSQATLLAYDITDRMRANRTAALNADYDINEGEEGTAGTVAGNDLIAWKKSIQATLPGYTDDGESMPADGSVRRDGRLFTVNIFWGDTTDDATDEASTTGARTKLSFTMQTQLTNQ
jgi:type IV pilus assembly protein PilV